MRILLLTSELPTWPPLPGGGRLSLRWVKELGGSHTFSLLAAARPEELGRLPALKEIFADVRTVDKEGGLVPRLARVGRLFSRRRPAAVSDSRRLRAALEEMLAAGAYDCVQLEDFSSGQYGRVIPGRTPRVLVFPELAGEVLRQQVWLARGLKKYYYFRQWKFSHYWEKWYAIWSGNVFVRSLPDRRTVESWDIGVRTYIMPPLVGPGPSVPGTEKRGEGRVLFFGDFSRPGAIDAAVRLKEEIMVRVRREYPPARCLVMGAAPPERIRRLAADDFAVSGEVTRFGSELAEAALLAVPLRAAGGDDLVLVEAMNAGCPVVATRLANTGVGARDGREIVLADRPEDFAAAVVRLLKSSGERERLGRAGREWVGEKFDRSRAREKMEEAYRKIAAGHR